MHPTSTARSERLDPESFANGYFRNAVYRHWDPYEDIPDTLLEQDRERLVADAPSEQELESLRMLLAMFGAGEAAVTEDLAPLLTVTEDLDEQCFLASQVYEEAKHTAFFDRYWREVIDPVAGVLGHEVTAPTDPRYFPEPYTALFDAVTAAMNRLLVKDTPETRVRAYCHYHLVVESVLAQTGYYSIEAIYGKRGPQVAQRQFPHLEGLVAGVARVRSDEGRHVGFGMHKVREAVQSGAVAPDVVDTVLTEQMANVAGIITAYDPLLVDPLPLVEYARERLTMRIDVITDAARTVPPVEELVELDGE